MVTVGSLAYQWLVNGWVSNKIYNKKGGFSIKRIIREEPVAKLEFAGLHFFVVATFHPSYFLRSKKGKPEIMAALKLARNLLEVKL